MDQAQQYESARKRIAAANAAMLHLLFGQNPITDAELVCLIAKRPEVYGRFAGYIGKRALPATPVPYIETNTETAYGKTSRMSRSVRVF